jgi:O-antigen/teichoic acid export membrane protein
LIVALAPFISKNLLATNDPAVSYWAAAISFGIFFPMFIPFVLQAQKRFVASIVVDNSLYLSRLIATLIFLALGSLTLGAALGSFVLGAAVSVFVGFGFIGIKFLFSKPKRDVYSDILRYSGWLGVNRIISSISGRLDIQMLAVLVGATATGLYSIPSRLASFIIVLTASFSSVLATRLAAFGDKEREKVYILKATLATVPIIAGIIFWIIIANPFITILFGDKYLPAVPVFQALTAAMIPFLLTAPSVTAITYAMKKTVYIGAYSFFQLAAIFALNFILIPKYGIYGPTITFGITNTILAIYTWAIVIRHYWVKK